MKGFLTIFFVLSLGLGSWKASELVSDGRLTEAEIQLCLFHGISWGAGWSIFLSRGVLDKI